MVRVGAQGARRTLIALRTVRDLADQSSRARRTDEMLGDPVATETDPDTARSMIAFNSATTAHLRVFAVALLSVFRGLLSLVPSLP
jgi:hypothetical protein